MEILHTLFFTIIPGFLIGLFGMDLLVGEPYHIGYTSELIIVGFGFLILFGRILYLAQKPIHEIQ